jgi:hypothetical protein
MNTKFWKGTLNGDHFEGLYVDGNIRNIQMELKDMGYGL